MDSIKDILMRRDSITEKEADEQIRLAKEELQALLEDGCLEEAEDICQTHFGLEPDYIMELV